MPQKPALKFALDAAAGTWAGVQARGDAEAMRATVERTVDLARIADHAGIESIWVMEDPDGWDAFSVLTAMARVTGRIRLGTGVTNPYYRHPSLIAASVTTLDLLSEGRAFLGLGRGQQEWYERALGMHVGKPARALTETLDLLDQWWSPERRASSAPDATEYHVDDWERVIRPLQSHVPVYLAAAGPIALGIAGRHTDGVIFNDLASITYMREAIEAVREAARAAGRLPEALSFYARTQIRITDDPEAHYERRKNTVVTVLALPGMERLMRTDEFDIEQIMADVRQAMRTDEILEVGGGFGDLRRGGDLEAAKRAVPIDLMRELVVAGSVAEVRARLRSYAEIGITHVFLGAQDASVTVDSLGEVLHGLAAES